MKKCPFCAEEVQDEAIKCKHCGSIITRIECPSCGTLNNVDAFRCKNENCLSILPQGKSTLILHKKEKAVTEVKYGGWIIIIASVIVIGGLWYVLEEGLKEKSISVSSTQGDEGWNKGWQIGYTWGQGDAKKGLPSRPDFYKSAAPLLEKEDANYRKGFADGFQDGYKVGYKEFWGK